MRSLRGRLTIGITLVLAVVIAGAGVMVSRYVERSERGAFDDRLKRTAELSRETAVVAIEQSLPPHDRRLDAVLGATATSVRATFGNTLLYGSGAPAPKGGPKPADGLRTYTAHGGRYRAYGLSISKRGLPGRVHLEVTTKLSPLEQRLTQINRRLAAFGIGALLVGTIGTWFLAGRILRPLRRLRAATSNIAGTEDLDRRVPGDDGPGELRSLAASFNAMLARLGRSAADRERALAATRRFTADAGHELRTPLTSVQATLSALSRHPDIPAERRSELVDDALSEHHRLVDLLDGLQALARGDSAPERGEIDLAEVVAGALDDVQPRHPGVTWTTDLPADSLPMYGWEAGVRMLVANLLENAARHGKPAGHVHVALEPGPVLHVDDDGPGVPPDQRERIFEPFVRVDGTTSPGSGLGLALVSQQAHAHAATVEAGPSPLGGARFSVRFGAGS
ncbi:MAG: two-component system, OmpR family, sensor histidine kinase PrrB [Solirubrobacteraceae bacterium]|jgi:signal transduction histidine kinase|nr:two-component system, OmpR family, sensor histidine kinase PrrB [Solirubrobacteraceae bacterium]